MQKDLATLLQRYKGVIFDLDGTLVNLNVDWVSLKKNLSVVARTLLRMEDKFTPLDESLLRIKREFGIERYVTFIDIVSEYEMVFDNYIVNDELLQYVRSNNNQLWAIYSMNTSKCIYNFIDKFVERVPDVVISKESCRRPKPCGDDIIGIMERWNLSVEEVVFVGNSEADRVSGLCAGVATLLVRM